MTTPARISATELARSLSDVLNRVFYLAEEFLIERNGETVAAVIPFRPAPITWKEFARRLDQTGPVGEEFADALEEIQATQPPLGASPWDS